MATAGTESTEKTCPECAESVKMAALVCRFCGHRFDGARSAMTSSTTGMSVAPKGRGLLIWALASAALMVVGSFGPWVEALGQSVAGTDATNDGWVVVAAAVAGGLLMYATRKNRGAGLWALLAGVLGSFVTIHDRSHASRVISSGGALLQAVAHIGWGLNLSLAASISFVIAGVVWLAVVGSEPVAVSRLGVEPTPTPDVQGQPND